jgi:hypothetical protein
MVLTCGKRRFIRSREMPPICALHLTLFSVYAVFTAFQISRLTPGELATVYALCNATLLI